VENSNSKQTFFFPPGGILLWIIIFLELITFGMAVVTFIMSANKEPEIFNSSRLQLNTTIGSINTIILIVSGYYMASAVKQYKALNMKKFFLLLKLTMLGGVLFMLFKGIEYYFKIESDLLIDTNTFFTFYWLLTLFHLVHVIVGLVILIVLYRNVKRQDSEKMLDDVEASAAFWHMCDLIWLLIFPIVYLFNYP